MSGTVYIIQDRDTGKFLTVSKGTGGTYTYNWGQSVGKATVWFTQEKAKTFVALALVHGGVNCGVCSVDIEAPFTYAKPLYEEPAPDPIGDYDRAMKGI